MNERVTHDYDWWLLTIILAICSVGLLEIWSATHADFRGIAGEANPDAWPPEHHGKRTILVYTAGQGTTLKLLEDLTDQEIDSRMPAIRARHVRSGGGNDAEPS